MVRKLPLEAETDPELLAHPWDRMANESHKAFYAFTLYRDLPANRTYQLVADKLRCAGSNVRRWARKWDWYSRAREWDMYQDRVAQEVQIRERRRMVERQAELGVMLQNVARMEMRKLQKKLEEGVAITDEKGEKRFVDCSLKSYEIARLAEIGSVLERRARAADDQERPQQINVIFEMDEPPPNARPEELNALARAKFRR